MTAKHRGIAVFDLDGTITAKDTYMEFIKYVKGRFAFYLGIFVLSPFIVLFYLKIYPNHRLKEHFFAYFFKSIAPEALTKKGADFASQILPKLCYPKAITTLAWHRQQGHRIIILTASSSIWLSKWCEEQGAELIGTEFEIKAGAYTGKIEGVNCYGQRKKEILLPILQAHHYEESYGYGDSASDKYFLELLKKPRLGAINS